MKKRPLRIEQALGLLPDLEALIPLKRAVFSGSREDDGVVRGSWSRYATVATRALSADDLHERIPELVQREADRALALYSAVVEALREAEAGNESAASAALIRAGESEEEAGLLESAQAFYERAQAVGSGLRDRRSHALAMRRLGRLAKAQGRLEQSIELYARAFELSEASGESEGAVIACQGMGNVLVEKGLWEEAEQWYLRGLESLDSAAPGRPLWQLQSNLSLVARRAGDLGRSREWLDSAKATVEALDDSSGRVYVLNAEGLLMVASGDPSTAETRYTEALEHATSSNEVARVLVNLGESLMLQQELEKAEQTYRRLELLALSEGLIISLPYAYRGLGAVAGARRDREGFLFFEQALELCRSRSLPQLEHALTQLEYGEFESEQGLIESAIARLQEAFDYFDTIGTAPERSRAEERIKTLRETLPTTGK